ncbi:MAG: deoxyuridine 5'-triphosphate nucleotidohydrolase [Candidatus Hermodarchaeota archaeon]|nr:deoxyuridine 5'-triphosphate nucleotidohydrolase [Candidatus Hermodarchaeota archaeon]
MVVLDRKTILELISKHKLITKMVDQNIQVSPNGVELTLQKLYTYKEAGTIDFSNKERHIPNYEEVQLKQGWYNLQPGTYLVTYNEIVRIPANIIAIGRPRSSLLRSGVSIESAVWDAGYEGRSRGLLTVYNPNGFFVKPNARLLHLVFFQLMQETQPYEGVYQGEA